MGMTLPIARELAQFGVRVLASLLYGLRLRNMVFRLAFVILMVAFAMLSVVEVFMVRSKGRRPSATACIVSTACWAAPARTCSSPSAR